MELKEQIIKALECCTSGNSVSACMSGCPLYEKEDCECINDDTALLKYALSLIEELTAKVAKWEEECDLRGDMWCKLNEENKKLTEENERWRLSCEYWMGEVKKARCAKSDTVRKMQERLMECFNNEVEHLAMYTEAQVIFAIDQIAKEMLEDL